MEPNPLLKLDPVFCAEYGRAKPDYSRAERALMRAVLEDGIRCYQGGGYVAGSVVDPRSKPWKLAEEARRWIFGVESNDEPMFTFDLICEALGYDADWLRRGLRGVMNPLKRRSRQPVSSSLLRVIPTRVRQFAPHHF